jgi:hypothetical protein
MIKIYFRYKHKINNLYMTYTEDARKINDHLQSMYPGATLVRVFLNRGISND